MHLIVQTYSLIELQQLRSELETRGIRVHVSDEFTYAIPGMPGAEQPRGIWIALPEDILPARQVVTDLVGAERLEPDPPPLAGEEQDTTVARRDESREQPRKPSGSTWQWIALIVAIATTWYLNA